MKYTMFTATEIEPAIGLAPRTVEMLRREKVAPAPASGGGQGRIARWDFEGLCGFVMHRALYRVMGEIVPAARVARSLMGEIRAWRHGGIPFGFRDLALLSEIQDMGDAVRDESGELCQPLVFWAAWRRGLADDASPQSNDFVLVIADAEWVGATNPRGMRYAIGRDGAEVLPMLRYHYAGRGAAVEVERIDTEAEEALCLERIGNAETVSFLNLSLALRRTLVRIAEAREGNA